MKIAILGSRDLTDTTFIKEAVDKYLEMLHHNYGEDVNLVFLQGGSKGATASAVSMFKDRDYDVVLFKPWHMVDRNLPFSTHLFFMRNKQMIDNSDRVVVIRNNVRDAEVDSAAAYAEKIGKHTDTFCMEVGDDVVREASS